MSHSLNLIEGLAQDRHAERYPDARTGGRAWISGRAGTRAKHRASFEARALEAARYRAGWLLVGLGLRLVAGGGAGGRSPG